MLKQVSERLTKVQGCCHSKSVTKWKWLTPPVGLLASTDGLQVYTCIWQVCVARADRALPALLLYHTTYSKTPHAKTHDTNLYTGPERGKILGNTHSCKTFSFEDESLDKLLHTKTCQIFWGKTVQYQVQVQLWPRKTTGAELVAVDCWLLMSDLSVFYFSSILPDGWCQMSWMWIYLQGFHFVT